MWDSVWRGVQLIVGCMSVSMGTVALAFAVVLLMSGNPSGVVGLISGGLSLYWGCWFIRSSRFMDNDEEA